MLENNKLVTKIEIEEKEKGILSTKYRSGWRMVTMNDVYSCKQGSLCRAPDDVIFVLEIIFTLTQGFETTFNSLRSAWNALNQRTLHLSHIPCT